LYRIANPPRLQAGRGSAYADRNGSTTIWPSLLVVDYILSQKNIPAILQAGKSFGNERQHSRASLGADYACRCAPSRLAYLPLAPFPYLGEVFWIDPSFAHFLARLTPCQVERTSGIFTIPFYSRSSQRVICIPPFLMRFLVVQVAARLLCNQNNLWRPCFSPFIVGGIPSTTSIRRAPLYSTILAVSVLQKYPLSDLYPSRRHWQSNLGWGWTMNANCIVPLN
jgi:hypothetical protein